MSVATLKLYEYDPTGMSPDNRIINESVSVNPADGIQDYTYFIPRATPYFADSLVIKDGTAPGARVLVENVDYWCTGDFISATNKLGKRICSTVAMLDSGYSGTLYITYQTLGGNYSLADASVMEALIRNRYSARHVSYEQIINLPAAFAPDEHSHKLDDLGGFDNVERLLKDLVDTIKSKPGSYAQLAAVFEDHINSNTAHTKDQVGLANVENLKIASLDDFKSNKQGYISVRVLREILEDLGVIKVQTEDGTIINRTAGKSLTNHPLIFTLANRETARFAVTTDGRIVHNARISLTKADYSDRSPITQDIKNSIRVRINVYENDKTLASYSYSPVTISNSNITLPVINTPSTQEDAYFEDTNTDSFLVSDIALVANRITDVEIIYSATNTRPIKMSLKVPQGHISPVDGTQRGIPSTHTLLVTEG